MPEWINQTAAVIQLVLNVAVVIGGAIIWKLYVANLRAAAQTKDATIESVEKSRDLWKEKAEQLQERSPEVVEKLLTDRIHVRDDEISRLKEDKEFDSIAVGDLERDKAQLEQALFRAQGFRAMLALEDGGHDEDLPQGELVMAEQAARIEVELIGEVAVDSGQLMITDPCYIDGEWRREHVTSIGMNGPNDTAVFSYSYDGACRSTGSESGYGNLSFMKGYKGAGVVFATAWGDGMYPVYAEKHDGRNVRIYINVG